MVFATGQSQFDSVGGISLERLEESWERAKAGLRFAVNFLKTNGGIEDESLLGSPFVIIPIAVLGVLRDEQLSSDEERDLLHWLLVANATGHYSRGSSESLLDADLSLLFRRNGSAAQLVEHVRQRFGRIRFRAADFAGRPARNPLFSTAYLALKKAGAQDWRSGLGLSLTHAGRAHYVQAHHVFPKSVMSKLGYESREINEIANLAFVSGGKNRMLGKRTPDEYFPEIIASRGEDALLLQGIPISPELWRPDQFLKFLEYRRAELADVVNRFLEDISASSGEASIDLQSLLQADENERVEFKETARVNVHTGAVDKEMEHEVVKTVAAFMNANGGTLVIGVHDGTGELRGLDRDIATLGRKDLDGFEQLLRQLFNTSLGPENSSQIAISFPVLDGSIACVVRVPRSPRAIYARNGSETDFFIRDGNTTRRLNSQTTVRYCADRFGGQG